MAAAEVNRILKLIKSDDGSDTQPILNLVNLVKSDGSTIPFLLTQSPTLAEVFEWWDSGSGQHTQSGPCFQLLAALFQSVLSDHPEFQTQAIAIGRRVLKERVHSVYGCLSRYASAPGRSNCLQFLLYLNLLGPPLTKLLLENFNFGNASLRQLLSQPGPAHDLAVRFLMSFLCVPSNELRVKFMAMKNMFKSMTKCLIKDPPDIKLELLRVLTEFVFEKYSIQKKIKCQFFSVPVLVNISRFWAEENSDELKHLTSKFFSLLFDAKSGIIFDSSASDIFGTTTSNPILLSFLRIAPTLPESFLVEVVGRCPEVPAPLIGRILSKPEPDLNLLETVLKARNGGATVVHGIKKGTPLAVALSKVSPEITDAQIMDYVTPPSLSHYMEKKDVGEEVSLGVLNGAALTVQSLHDRHHLAQHALFQLPELTGEKPAEVLSYLTIDPFCVPESRVLSVLVSLEGLPSEESYLLHLLSVVPEETLLGFMEKNRSKIAGVILGEKNVASSYHSSSVDKFIRRMATLNGIETPEILFSILGLKPPLPVTAVSEEWSSSMLADRLTTLTQLLEGKLKLLHVELVSGTPDIMGSHTEEGGGNVPIDKTGQEGFRDSFTLCQELWKVLLSSPAPSISPCDAVWCIVYRDRLGRALVEQVVHSHLIGHTHSPCFSVESLTRYFDQLREFAVETRNKFVPNSDHPTPTEGLLALLRGQLLENCKFLEDLWVQTMLQEDGLERFQRFIEKLPQSTLEKLHHALANIEEEWRILIAKMAEDALNVSHGTDLNTRIPFEMFQKLSTVARGMVLNKVTPVTKEEANDLIDEAFLSSDEGFRFHSASFFTSDTFEEAAKLTGCLRSKKWLKRVFEFMVGCGDEEVCSQFLSSHVSVFEKTLPVFTRRKCEGVLMSLATESRPTGSQLRIASHLVLTFQDILTPTSITQTLLSLLSLEHTRATLVEGGSAKLDTVHLLHTLLQTGKVEESALTPALYSLLQSAYTATTTPADETLLNSLKLLQHRGVSSTFPFAYGPHVAQMRGIRNIALFNEHSCRILEGLDLGLMMELINHFPLTSDEKKGSGVMYSVEYVLSLLHHVLTTGEMEARTVLGSPISRVAFLSLSSYDPTTRAVGYRCMGALLRLCEEGKFKERSMSLHLLRLLENSVTERAERIPHLVAYFLGVFLGALFTPHRSLFPTVCHFLLQRPVLDFGDVPLFYKMFCSAEGTVYRHDQNWLLETLCHAVRDENDYKILSRRHVLQLCFSQLHCPDTDPATVRLIKRLFERVLGIRKSKVQKELAEQGICREILTL